MLRHHAPQIWGLATEGFGMAVFVWLARRAQRAERERQREVEREECDEDVPIAA